MRDTDELPTTSEGGGKTPPRGDAGRAETRGGGRRAGDAGYKARSQTRPDTDAPSAISVRAVATSYEAALVAREGLLAEKDARIADMAARIVSLERGMGELFEALRREQTLRALPPPPVDAATPADIAWPVTPPPEAVPEAAPTPEAEAPAEAPEAEAAPAVPDALSFGPPPDREDAEPTPGGTAPGQTPPWRKPSPDPNRTLYTGIPGVLDIRLSPLMAGDTAPPPPPDPETPEPQTPDPAPGTAEGASPAPPPAPASGPPWTALLDRLAHWVGD